MSLYSERILPHLIDRACSLGQVMKRRSQIVPRARGRVLEVGMGSGINLPLYDPNRVELVYGLEPSAGMRRKAQPALERSPVAVEWLDLPGEEVPLDDDSVDTVLLTFTLCTIPDWRRALQQMQRVLKPGGQLLFVEHGRSPEPRISRWQQRITPVWKPLAGGCHLDRPIDRMIREGGFDITELEADYLPRAPRIAAWIYQGCAVHRT
ncbi:MAG: class I SAM-dependent methyltransferase [Pseudomonadota bacterium]